MPAADAKKYSYDEIPYSNHPFPQTNPERLATVAKLFGMTPRPAENCRVLELGSGRGANLISIAEQFPASQFVGVELSQVQTGEIRACIDSIGLENVQLHQMDILDVGASFGQFDYIIAHGVFSWIPRKLQDKLLDIYSSHLSPQGVAFVSYNTFPGWNMRGMIRDMMCYHTGQFDDPRTRIQQARGLLNFLSQHTSDQNAYGMLLKSELETLSNHDDSYLFHDHLEEVNEPVYFYQFAQRAQSYGLQYLGETDMSMMYSGHFPAEVTTTLENVAADLIQMEQYMDFLRNRMFRQTLLCHQNVTIDRELRPADLKTLYIASPLMPAGPPAQLLAPGAVQFTNATTGQGVAVDSPLLKAALACLAEAWPGYISFDQLLAESRSRIGSPVVASASELESENYELGKVLLKFYVSNLIELHSTRPCFSTRVDEFPAASRLARFQAETGNSVVTLRQECRTVSDLERHVLRLLDGTRDRPKLMEVLRKLVDDQVLVLQPPVAGADAIREALDDALEHTLHQLARSALLIADVEQ